MDPLRQSIDLSRLVIAKDFFASPAKPHNRGPILSSSQQPTNTIPTSPDENLPPVEDGQRTPLQKSGAPLLNVAGCVFRQQPSNATPCAAITSPKICVPAEKTKQPPQEAKSPDVEPRGWPLRLGSIVNRVSPHPVKPSERSPSLQGSPNRVSPSLREFLRESPALLGQSKIQGGETEAVEGPGRGRGGVIRALSFGESRSVPTERAPVSQRTDGESDRFYDLSLEGVLELDWVLRADRALSEKMSVHRMETGIRGEARTQTMGGPPSNVPPRQTAVSGSEQAPVNPKGNAQKLVLLAAPPKRTPRLLERSRNAGPFTPAEGLPCAAGANTLSGSLKTPVGWMRFNNILGENDENATPPLPATDVGREVDKRRGSGSILAVTQNGHVGSAGHDNSPLGGLGGPSLEVPRGSPGKSKALQKSPRGSSHVGGSENGVSGRLAPPVREPFEQVSENAAAKGGRAAKGCGERKSWEQETVKKLRSPAKSARALQLSPLDKSSLAPSAEHALQTSATTSATVSTAGPENDKVSLGTVDPTPISNPQAAQKPELCKSTDCKEKTGSRSGAPTVDFEKPLRHAPQAASVVSFAAEEGTNTAGATAREASVNGVQKPRPRCEDSEFRAGLAALANLKLTTEQGLGKEELPPWGAWRPESGPANEAKFGDVEAAQLTEWKARDGLVESSVDEKTDDELGGRSSEQKLEDGVAESGEKVVRLEELAGKSKWGLGFGRFGRKGSGMAVERKSAAEKRQRNGTESVTGTDPKSVKGTEEEEDGKAAREAMSEMWAEKEGGDLVEGTGIFQNGGVPCEGGVKRGGKKEGGSKSKKRRKEETGPVEDGVPSAVGMSSGVAEQLREKQGLQKKGRAAEKGSKKGLLRKALTLKRSKTGKTLRKEVTDAASEGVTRGDAAEAAVFSPREACHVPREARARDTPVKITLEGVKIVVLPKEGADDVSNVAAGGMGEEFDVGTPKAMSAGDLCHVASTHSPSTVPGTEHRLQLLVAALERAQRTAPQTPKPCQNPAGKINVPPSPEPGTTSPFEMATTSPCKFSPCVNGSPQLLCKYGSGHASPVGSAERLKEVRRRMEARTRALSGGGSVSSAARKLHLAEGGNEKEVTARAAAAEKQWSGSRETGEGRMESEVAEVSAETGLLGLLSKVDVEGQGSLPGETVEGGMEKEVVAPSATNEKHGLVSEAEVEGECAEAGGREGGDTERLEDKGTEIVRSPEAPADGASFGATGSGDCGATNPATLAGCSEKEVDEVTGPPRNEQIVAEQANKKLTREDVESVASPSRKYEGEGGVSSPVEAFNGAAAFFRAAVYRSNASVGVNMPASPEVGGNREAAFEEPREGDWPNRPELKVSPEKSPGETKEDISPEVARRSTVDQVVGNGDTLTVEEPIKSLRMGGRMGDSWNAEESPEGRPRGAAAFFFRGTKVPIKTPKKAIVCNERPASTTQDVPRVSAQLSGPTDWTRGTSPPVKTGNSSLFAVLEQPVRVEPLTEPCARETETGGQERRGDPPVIPLLCTGSQSRDASPQERVPNAAAFFGRGGVPFTTNPVVPRVVMPLQELKGFANKLFEQTQSVAEKVSGVSNRENWALASESGQETGKEEKVDSGGGEDSAVGMRKNGGVGPGANGESVEGVPQGMLATPALGPRVPLKANGKGFSDGKENRTCDDSRSTSADVPGHVSVASSKLEVVQGTGSSREIPQQDRQDSDAQRSSRIGSAVGKTLVVQRSGSNGGMAIGQGENRNGSLGTGDARASEAGSKEMGQREVEMEGRKWPEERREGVEKVKGRATQELESGPAFLDKSLSAPARSDAHYDVLRRENEKLKAQLVLLQEEKNRIAKQMEANNLKANANSAFTKGRFEDAKRLYNQALELRVNDDQFNAVILTNRAAANLALGAAMDALADCAAALRTDPKCASAVLRKVDACLAIGDWETAMTDLTALERSGIRTEDVRRKAQDLKAKMWRAPAQLDYYGILGLPTRSNMTAVKNAYKRLALRHHPDRAGHHADIVFQYIARAYQVLSNSADKKKYDALLQRSLK